MVLFLPVETFQLPHRTRTGWTFLLLFLLTVLIRSWLSEWWSNKRLSRRNRKIVNDRRISINLTEEDRKRQAVVAASRLMHTLKFARSARNEWLRGAKVEGTRQLGLVLLDPSHFVSRVTENYDLGNHKLGQGISRTLQFDAKTATAPYIYFPILRSSKGRLVDQLSVEANGTRVSTLSYSLSQGAALCVVESQYFAYTNRFPLYDGTDHLWNQVVEVLTSDSAEQGIALDKLFAGVDEERLRDLDALPVSAHDRAGLDKAQKVSGANFRALVEKLKSHYYIIVRLKRPETLDDIRVRVALTRPRTEYLDNWVDRLRVSLGMSVRNYLLPLPHALEAPSHHFQGAIDPQMYVYKQQLSLAEYPKSGRTNGPNLTTRVQRPELVSGDVLGMDYMHSYARDLRGIGSSRDGHAWGLIDGDDSSHAAANDSRGGHRADPSDETELAPVVLVELRERPPGLLAMVLIIAGYLAVLTLGVSVFYDHVFPVPDPTGKVTGAASWPTILFGVPAIVSGWIASRFGGEAIARISLSTFLAGLWCVVNAGAAVEFSAVRLSVGSTAVYTVGPVKFTHIAWLLITVSVVANFGSVACMMIARARRYVDRLAAHGH
jgi:hypothetical protein